MNDSHPELSIIMPTFERGEVFELSKKHLIGAIEGKNYEFIIVNDSKREKLTTSLSDSDRVKIYNNPGQGVASARNYGAKLAGSPFLLFVDDDMIISPENLEKLMNLVAKIDVSRVCINVDWEYPAELIDKIKKTQFGRFLIHYGFTDLKGWNGVSKWGHSEPFVQAGLTSQFFFITRENFNNIGGYDEGFPHAGFEDEEFSFRLTQKLKVLLDPTNTVRHNEADRMSVQSWMARKKRGGLTRKIAVLKGRKNLEIKYSVLKKVFYTISSKIFPVYYGLLKLIPNHKYADKLYFQLIKIMLGTAIYEGYNSVNELKNPEKKS
ncbi:MAG: glycosyltransferase family 2 protein [Brumimicrobium sp.]|nr:glycosyltransferase family 2 protein [Brumimicrobium sp.]